MPEPQIGWYEVELTERAATDPVLGGLPARFASFQWHSWSCELPPDAVPLAGEAEQLDAFRLGEAWGIQFHPEVTAEIVAGWLADHESDDDAVAAGFDPAPVEAETPGRIPAANRIGRRIFQGFLEYAERGR